MQGLKPLVRRRFNVRDSIMASIHTTEPENLHYRLTPKRSFIDLYQVPLSLSHPFFSWWVHQIMIKNWIFTFGENFTVWK